MAETVLYCIWPKCDEHCYPSAGVCSRHLKRTILPALPQWQTMDSAPRDGTRFWGKVEDDAISMLWHEGFGAFVSVWRRMQMASGYLIDGQPYRDHSPVVHKPTHWMPVIALTEPQP